MAYTPKGDRNFMASLKRTMDKLWFGADVSSRAQYPNVLSGEYLLSGNNALSGTVGLVGSDASDQVTYPLQVGIPLTSAQLLALNTTPVTLIPAPGAGFAAFLESMVFEMNRTATAYAGGTGGVNAVYAGATGTAVSAVIPATVFTTAGAATTLLAIGGQHVVGSTAAPILANTAVQLFANAALTTGTGTAKVYVTYSIITV